MTIPTEFALAAVVTTGIGAAMMRLGLRRGSLEARVDSRRCASCGQIIKARTCRHCSLSCSSR